MPSVYSRHIFCIRFVVAWPSLFKLPYIFLYKILFLLLSPEWILSNSNCVSLDFSSTLLEQSVNSVSFHNLALVFMFYHCLLFKFIFLRFILLCCDYQPLIRIYAIIRHAAVFAKRGFYEQCICFSLQINLPNFISSTFYFSNSSCHPAATYYSTLRFVQIHCRFCLYYQYWHIYIYLLIWRCIIIYCSQIMFVDIIISLFYLLFECRS